MASDPLYPTIIQSNYTDKLLTNSYVFQIPTLFMFCQINCYPAVYYFNGIGMTKRQNNYFSDLPILLLTVIKGELHSSSSSFYYIFWINRLDAMKVLTCRTK